MADRRPAPGRSSAPRSSLPIMENRGPAPFAMITFAIGLSCLHAFHRLSDNQHGQIQRCISWQPWPPSRKTTEFVDPGASSPRHSKLRQRCRSQGGIGLNEAGTGGVRFPANGGVDEEDAVEITPSRPTIAGGSLSGNCREYYIAAAGGKGHGRTLDDALDLGLRQIRI